MQTEEILALLIAERDKLNRAIEALSSPIKRRGRPRKNAAPDLSDATVPDWVQPKSPTKKAKGGKRTFTPEQRAEQAARMKSYWAKKKRAAKKAA